MRRRQAIGLIGLAAAGSIVFPSCEFTSVPLLKNFNIKKSEYKKLEQLSAKILPIPDEMILSKMSPSDFTLIMMDDCEKKEDIDKFKSEMVTFLIENSEIESIEIEALAEKLENSYFLRKVRDYNITYYRGLEEYLNKYTDFEFIPGRFNGCYTV